MLAAARVSRSLMVLALFFAASACSQTQYLQSGDEPTSLRGLIDPQMMKQVAQALSQGHRDFTIDSSNGGSVLTAEIIAAMIKAKDGSLTATGRCYSACALMLLGVQRKFVDGDAEVAIHGAAVPTRPNDDKAADAAVQYMIQNGLPENIARTRGTGINLYKLTPAELAEAGVSGVGR